MNEPPCSSWAIWVGPEVEGDQAYGVRTLFIRSLASFPTLSSLDDFSFLKEKSKCNRVWFCKEMTEWKLVKAIAKHFESVCIETEPKCYDSIPLDLRQKSKIYLKVNTPLKREDVICVGPAFSDESFEIGKGMKVKPEDYLKDKKIA